MHVYTIKTFLIFSLSPIPLLLHFRVIMVYVYKGNCGLPKPSRMQTPSMRDSTVSSRTGSSTLNGAGLGVMRGIEAGYWDGGSGAVLGPNRSQTSQARFGYKVMVQSDRKTPHGSFWYKSNCVHTSNPNLFLITKSQTTIVNPKNVTKEKKRGRGFIYLFPTEGLGF